MQFGMFDHLDASGRPLQALYEERLRLIELGEAAGFRAYHLAEHHATPLGMAPSPNVFLAAAAQRTRRLRLGPMVYCVPFYHPVRLFQEICMLDQMSGGRLEFGIGRGISPIEAKYLGVDADAAPAMFEEALALILEAMRGGPVSFHGRFYEIDNMPVEMAPLQRPHPPLWYGVVTPESAGRAAERGMSFMTNRPTEMVRGMTAAYREAWAARGRAESELPLLGMTRHVVVAESGAKALEIARRAYLPWRKAFMKLWLMHGMEPPNVRLPETIDPMLEAGAAVAGTPTQVRETVLRQFDEAGANYFVARIAFGDMSFDEARRSIELFAEHVIAAVPAAA